MKEKRCVAGETTSACMGRHRWGVFKSQDNTYYAIGTFSFLLPGNKEKLAEKGYGMPISFKELLDPKWNESSAQMPDAFFQPPIRIEAF